MAINAASSVFTLYFIVYLKHGEDIWNSSSLVHKETYQQEPGLACSLLASELKKNSCS